jgi:hypothetical protein
MLSTESGGIRESNILHGSSMLIREALISLILQPRDYSIHFLANLRERFIWLFLVPWPIWGRSFSHKKEDETCGQNPVRMAKGYGLGTLTSPSLRPVARAVNTKNTVC